MRITIEQAVTLLREGEVVAIPTETVYGLAADLKNPDAVDKIFEIKQRPSDKPLITLVSTIDQVIPFLDGMPNDFQKLAKHFWPGALTLVMPIKSGVISSNVTRGNATEGFRIPGHPTTLELLHRFGPVVAPSANFSGNPSTKSADEVEREFGKDFPVLDGGVCSKGVESTILMYENGKWKIIRLGAISALEISQVVGYGV